MTPIWISLILPLPLQACPGLQLRLMHYTPQLASLDDERHVALEVSGSLKLFGGARSLWRKILGDCPPGTQAGMAPTPWGALLLAGRTRGPRRALRVDTLQRQLDTLPVTALDLAAPAALALDDWGCRTLGQLRRLPRAGLAQRALTCLLDQLDRAYQPTTPAPPRLAPALRFKASREPTYRGTSLAAMETALVPLLEALCDRLQAHQAAADRLELWLHHDDTRARHPTTRVTLLFSAPQWRIQACLALCRLRLQALTLPDPVVRITLLCPRLRPRRPLPTSLLPDAQVDRQHEAQLLDALRARLGPESLHFPQLSDWPLPEHAEAWSPRPQATSRARARPTRTPGRPFWLLPHPVRLTLREGHPVWKGHPLRLIGGPERIEGGWWRHPEGPHARDYFTASDPHAARYWIYHDLACGHWFLHGLFA